MSMKKYFKISLKWKKVLAIFILLIILFIFAPKAQAYRKELYLYYYGLEYAGDGQFSEKKIFLPENLNIQEKADLIYFELFHNTDDLLFPDHNLLIDCVIANNHLTVDVDGSILLFGGNSFESDFVKLLAKNATNLEGIDTLTILIDGKNYCLAEGTFVFQEAIIDILNVKN